eukprot:25225_1
MVFPFSCFVLFCFVLFCFVLFCFVCLIVDLRVHISVKRQDILNGKKGKRLAISFFSNKNKNKFYSFGDTQTHHCEQTTFLISSFS